MKETLEYADHINSDSYEYGVPPPNWVVWDECGDIDMQGNAIPKKHKFVLEDVEELADKPDAEYLIEGIIYPKDVGILVAPSASGKTFVALDLLFSCATGTEFANRFQVNKPMDVLYACGEGGSGINKRLLATKEHFGHNREEHKRVVILKTVPNLCEKADVSKFISELQEQSFKPDFIIIDTLHTAIAGHDDSSNRDMGIMFESAKLIRDTFQCVIMLVHHTGKDGNGYRGASSLEGDVDFFISIKGDKSPTGKSLVFDKIKDGERPQNVRFDLVAKCDSLVVHWSTEDSKTCTDKQLQYAKDIIGVLAQNKTNWFTIAEISESISGKKSKSKENTIRQQIAKLQANGFVSTKQEKSQSNGQEVTLYQYLKEVSRGQCIFDTGNKLKCYQHW